MVVNFSFKKRKAQMKIQQMSFLLVAVFIFFALLAILLVSIYLKQIKTEQIQIEDRNAHLLVSRIANSPEFSCAFDSGLGEVDCVDADKVMILKENIDKYKNFWGLSNIEIIRIFPSNLPQNMHRECTITGSNPTYPNNCNTINLMGNSTATGDASNFVALCRKELYSGEIINKCELAKLIVRYGGI